MALLTDGNPNDTLALQVYESAILDVAHVEKIDLAIKLTLATQEIADDVLDILLDHTPLDHTRAFDPGSTVRRTIGVSDVVVSPQMQRWHALHTLEIFYRDAFNDQLNDRYQAKFLEYRELSKDAQAHTVRFGIGLALNPIPEAQQPALSAVGGTGAAGTFYVQVSWVSATGQEGAPSDATALGTAALQNLVVQPVNPPAVATGFNVYIGVTENALARQNASPVAVGDAFTMPSGGLIAGAAPGTGQAADIFVVGGPTLRRG
jgi:hypothetical protein